MADETTRKTKRSGRVEFDSRGNSVWKWENAEGDSTSILLKRLENDELELEPTRPVPTLGKRVAEKGGKASKRSESPGIELEKKSKGGGFNPYDNS